MTEENNKNNELVVVTANVKGAVETMRKFQDLKKELLEEQDTVMISDKNFIKRSGWRKFALAFNVTTDIVNTFPIKEGDRIVGYTVEARATASNNRFATDIGSCELSELQGERTHHNCITKAATRAINRAISDLIGGGELSAEEIDINAVKSNPRQGGDSISPKQLKYLESVHNIGNALSEQINKYLEQHDKTELAVLTKQEAHELIDLIIKK